MCVDSYMAGNEHCICRDSNVRFSNVECTGQFACIFGDWDRGVKTKCLVLFQVNVLIKMRTRKEYQDLPIQRDTA